MQWRGWLILLCIEIFSQSYWKLPMSSNAIFFGERHFARKYLLPKNIASSRLVAPGSPWMHSALEINCVRIKEGKQVLILCFVKKTLEKMFYLLVSHTNAHAIRSKLDPHQNITSDFETGRSTNSISWKRWKRWKKWIPQIYKKKNQEKSFLRQKTTSK